MIKLWLVLKSLVITWINLRISLESFLVDFRMTKPILFLYCVQINRKSRGKNGCGWQKTGFETHIHPKREMRNFLYFRILADISQNLDILILKAYVLWGLNFYEGHVGHVISRKYLFFKAFYFGKKLIF